MWQLRFWAYLLLIALSLAPVQRVLACSCVRAHPQSLFCDSDFVALVRVKNAAMSDYSTGYTVKTSKIFKVNSLKSYHALKKNMLWTSSSDGMCGVYLEIGETYVVSGTTMGDRARISICGLALQWRMVPSRQRKAFKELYRHGCNCSIHYTPWWYKGAVLANAGGKECLWESVPGPEDCQREYGVCKAGSGGCSWVPSVPYKNCIKEHQQKREQQRAREP